MNLIGDIERFVAEALYPWRVPIVIVAMVVVVAFVWFAGRRGWFEAARRRPLVTGAVVLVALLLLAPVTWYLAAPLFISRTVVEAAPSLLAGGSTDATPPLPRSTTASAPRTATTEEPTAAAAERTGTFVGADEFHFGSGTARLLQGEAGAWTVRLEDFAVRNGPDLYVYLSPSPDGYAEGALELGTLKADTGAFNYEVPAGMDPGMYQSVVVWCKQFAVQFAHAALGS